MSSFCKLALGKELGSQLSSTKAEWNIPHKWLNISKFYKDNQAMTKLENSILINCENNKNLKSKEFSFSIEFAMFKAFVLYFSNSKLNTFIFTLSKWYNSNTTIIHGILSFIHFLASYAHLQFFEQWNFFAAVILSL